MENIITILEDSNATIVYHPDSKIIHHTLNKPLVSADLRPVLTTGLEAFKQHGANKWLSDDRKGGPLSPEDDAWATTEWFPQMMAAGWKFWALVVPDDVMARMDMVRFVESYFEQGLRIMVFAEVEEALNWLVRVDQ